MTAQNFPISDITYKINDQAYPHMLVAGHFLSRGDVYDLAENSTTPHIEIGTGDDFLIISAGTYFNVETRETGWMVEVLSEEGIAANIKSVEEIYEDGIRVCPSRHSL
ncbi:MAG: hypothetical protein H9W81_08050 [Enterococcus sp.]|nr:hypothetical protein [Enterococcus sp.]